MILTKTYFSEKISRLKPSRKNYYFFSLCLTAIMITTAPTHSEEVANSMKHVIACETQKVCVKFQESLQAKLDKLEAKGIENLTDEEFEKFALLSDELIAVEKSQTKAKSDLIDAIDKTDAQISGLRGALLEN